MFFYYDRSTFLSFIFSFSMKLLLGKLLTVSNINAINVIILSFKDFLNEIFHPFVT